MATWLCRLLQFAMDYQIIITIQMAIEWRFPSHRDIPIPMTMETSKWVSIFRHTHGCTPSHFRISQQSQPWWRKSVQVLFFFEAMAMFRWEDVPPKKVMSWYSRWCPSSESLRWCVYNSHVTLVHGRYNELVFMGFINQLTSLGGHHPVYIYIQ